MWMEHPGKVLGLVALQMVIFVLLLSLNLGAVVAQSDADAMQELKKSLNLPSSVDWTDANPCNWQHVRCVDNRVTRIQLGNKGVSGSLSPSVAKLTELQILELMGNNLTGPLPSLKGLEFLNVVWLGQNQFNSIPVDFFDGLTRLVDVYLDHNPFSRWSIPDGLHVANTLANFSVNSANVTGKIPDFFNPTNFPSLQNLHLSGNALEGPLPSSFGVLTVQSLWLNGQFDSAKGQKTLNGTIEFLGNMTQLVQVWLNKNGFTGPIPDLSGLSALKDLNLRDNSLTGPVPTSLVNLKLNVVNLTNNHLQGPTPKFSSSVNVDMKENSNSFCLPDPGVECDKRVDVLISVLEPAKYPWKLADGWKGNDPCTFTGITCLKGNITIINLQGLNLSGIISPNFAALTSVQTLILSHNNITGEVPTALATMPNLKTLDLSFNHLNVNHLPQFESRTAVNVDGNSPLDPSSTGEGRSSTDTRTGGKGKLIGGVIGSVCAVLVVGLILFYCQKRKRKYGRVKQSNAVVVHPNHPDAVKISVTSGGESFSQGSSGSSDVHVIKTPDMVISIQVLRSVTNNFSEKNILGKGGFGTVYYGELPNGTKIAVKRMNSAVLGDKGLAEFKSEIAVLSKVRHRHLVALLGYCLDGNEKVLVYEYLPQGTLSQHLFSWKEIGWKPLEWKQRLTIALDVARGVEYLHGLAHQSFIHRDLKPSNILLGDDMRAKVADFGLVRLAPDGGKVSIETRLAGTFGYLAPEYAVTGRITTKVDIFSFGVILMEIITGRKALDESQPEDSVHLVTWFRRVYINKTTFQKAIDPTIDLDEETLASVNIIAELACHCCAREHSQRPEMGHIVNVLSSLTDKWKPTEDKSDDVFGIDLDMTLPQALKKWQALGDSNMDDSSSSSLLASDYSTQTSLPTRPTGFATSFASADGR